MILKREREILRNKKKKNIRGSTSSNISICIENKELLGKNPTIRALKLIDA